MLAIRYVLGIVWPRALFLMLVGWLLFSVLDSMEAARWLARGTAWEVAMMYLCRAPEMMQQLMGPGVVLGTLAGVGMLNRRAEVTALAAAGRSLRGTVLPAVLVVSGGGAVLNAVLAEYVVPRTGREALRLATQVFQMFDARYYDFHARNEWFRAGPIYARAQPSADLSYDRVMGVVLDGQHIRQRILAGTMAPVDDENFTLRDAAITTLPPGTAYERSEEKRMYLPSAAAALSVPMGYPEHYTWSGLVDAVDRRERGGRDAGAYRVALLRRVSDPLMVLLLGFLAVPLAARQRRDAPVERLLFVGGLAVAGAQVLMILGDAAAGRNLVAPWLAALAAPVMVLVAALVVWRRAEGSKTAR